jgi:uncharacterized protein (TIGR00369 family)
VDIQEDKFCFVCGVENPGGLRAQFTTEAETRRSYCRLIIPVGFQGWREVVHGGVISALLDEAAIYACRRADEPVVTAELIVRFKKPVPVGREVEVVGELVEERKRVLSAHSWLKLEGRIHAEAEVRIVRI